jgi:hypothetical protein
MMVSKDFDSQAEELNGSFWDRCSLVGAGWVMGK